MTILFVDWLLEKIEDKKWLEDVHRKKEKERKKKKERKRNEQLGKIDTKKKMSFYFNVVLPFAHPVPTAN